MPKSRWIWFLAILASFLCGVAAVPLGSKMFDGIFTDGRVEEARVTSPDGQFDAVISREAYGGAAGGFNWYVFVVAKGGQPNYEHSSFPHYVFSAGDLSGGRLVWDQPHLLEIEYDKAEIQSFRNLWGQYEIQNTGPESFMVEIRLLPSTASYSLLTPEGKFR